MRRHRRQAGGRHLDHAREVAGVGELEHDVELVVLDERGEVLDHVRVVQLLHETRTGQTRREPFCICSYAEE